MRSSRFHATAAGLVAAAGLVVSGCGVPVHARPYSPADAEHARGVVYHLPKALLQVDFTLKLTLRPKVKCAETVNECDTLQVRRGDAVVETPKLETVAVPDLAAGFVIDSPESFLVSTNFEAQINEKGELVSSKAKSESKAVEVATWGLETLTKIAKVMAMAGRSGAPARHEKAKLQEQLEVAIARLDERVLKQVASPVAPPADGKAKKGKAEVESIAGAAAEIDKILALKAKLRAEVAALDTELVKTLSVPVTCLFDPTTASTFAISGDKAASACPAYVAIAGALTNMEVVHDPLPILMVQVNDLGASPAAALPLKNEVKGFVYRIPAWFRVELKSERGSQVDKVVALPQRGRLAVFAIADSDLRPGKTIEVSLHPSLGLLNQVKLNGEPIKLESATKLVDSATALATVGKDAEVARLEKEAALLAAQRKYLEEVTSLEKAKQEADKARVDR